LVGSFTVIVVVAVVVIAVIVPRSRQSHNGSSDLTMDQFVWMLQNDPNVSLGPGYTDQPPDTVTQLVRMDIFSTTTWWDLAATPPSNSCSTDPKYAEARHSLQGVALPEDTSMTNPADVWQVLLFDTQEHAQDVFAWETSCAPPQLYFDHSEATAVDGVNMAGAVFNSGGPDGAAGCAQYRNVIFCSPGYEPSNGTVPGSQPNLTWDQWVSQASVLRAAVDSAALH